MEPQISLLFSLAPILKQIIPTHTLQHYLMYEWGQGKRKLSICKTRK